ncbi:MAG: KH domain-containing protein [bacterium]|nr:KH domain-containing protein [bacterium]
MAKDKLKTTKTITEKLLKLMGIEVKAEVTEDKENQSLNVQIETTEPGVLIGYHGETISALQLVLGLMVHKEINEWQRIVVNVGDYREKRTETLTRMALNAAQKAHFSGQPIVLNDLSSSERRIIHLALKDNAEVETFSEGEGRERRLVIKPR